MPAEFEAGILYVSKEFGIAGHLCACGCGNRIMTPLGAAEWAIKTKNDRISMWPSIGNGQLQCKSHYIIRNSKIIWCHSMTDDWTKTDLERAEKKRKHYFNQQNWWNRFRNWIKKLLQGVLNNIIC